MSSRAGDRAPGELVALKQMRTNLAPLVAFSLCLCLALPRSAVAESAPAAATAPPSEAEWRAARSRQRLVESLEATALTTAWAGATGATLWAGLHLAETSDERRAMGIRLLGSSVLTALPVLAATSERGSSSSGALNALDDLARIAMAVVAPPLAGLSTWGIGELSRASHRPGLGFLGATGGAAVGLAGSLLWQDLVGEIVGRAELMYWVMQVVNVVMVNSMANLSYFLASGGPR